jgi:hypothetical protein
MEEVINRIAEIKSRTMLRAAEAVEGIEQLSKLLSVPKDLLLRWIAGTEQPSEQAFFIALDILLENDRQMP